VFGVTLVTAPAGPDLYESTAAPGLLAPANVVASGVASPHVRAPPPVPLLFYFVDDGRGSPAIIYVARTGGSLAFTF
jgi:hypothetical protein